MKSVVFASLALLVFGSTELIVLASARESAIPLFRERSVVHAEIKADLPVNDQNPKPALLRFYDSSGRPGKSIEISVAARGFTRRLSPFPPFKIYINEQTDLSGTPLEGMDDNELKVVVPRKLPDPEQRGFEQLWVDEKY